jgi:RNA polymerase sigma factor (sigma-70 family)
MQNWQKHRNYRKHKNPDGSDRYMVTVDGTEVEVSAEVYAAYSRADRKERYMRERDAGRILSLDRLVEDSVPLESAADTQTESIEDALLNKLSAEQLAAALLRLTSEEQRLLRALVIDGVTERDYAAMIGMSQKGVNKRKQKALKKMFGFLVLKPSGFREG